MGLTLTITDNGNGTGGIATIAGSDPSSLNTVYAQSANANIATPNFAAQGNRAGDGTIALPTAADIWWFYCQGIVGGLPVLSPLVLKAITTGQDAIHEQALRAVVSLLQVLNFNGTTASPAGIQPSSIYDQLVPVDVTINFPAICCWIDSKETIKANVNSADDYGYPVYVAILDANESGDYRSPRAKYLKWRQQIHHAFSNQRLAAVPVIFNCIVETGLIVSPTLPLSKYFRSGMTLRFFTRQGRGLSA